jgi:hypothetical protein
MNENVRGNGGHGFLMFALGTTAGAIVALLTAPRSGKETRRRLQDTLQQVKEKAGNVRASMAKSYTREADALKDGVITAFDKDPVRAASAHDAGRPAMGAASKPDPTTNFSLTTSSGRTGPSYSGNSPK